MNSDVLAAAGARTTLFDALRQAARRFGASRPIIEDQQREALSYRRLILASLVIGAPLADRTERGETVGVLLPNATALVALLFGLSAFGRVAALLNPTAGQANLDSAVRTAQIRTIVTSRRFVEKGKLLELIAEIAAIEAAPGRPVGVLYLEDIRAELTSFAKALALARALIPGLAPQASAPEETAVILFTSGAEGRPKGVALSHLNLIANTRQIEAHIGAPPLGTDQVALNPLPMFHSLGLTGGLLLPLFSGMKTVLYPSPLHYRQIPKLIGEVKATILFGTDTFLQGWARAAEPGDLQSVRFAVAGAERVRAETRALWERHGTIILEGYGATECSPVVSVNQPFDNAAGTVGRLLPGIDYRLEPVEGLAEGGSLRVRGPNVMQGYLLAENPGIIKPPPDGWHDTGDIVSLDAEGRLILHGRLARFAKIGGEMVSLAAIETQAGALWPDATHVAVGLPDPRKGEEIVLVTDRTGAERAALSAFMRSQGYSELWTPKAILVAPAIPILGSGKIDFASVRTLAQAMRSAG